MKTTKSDKKAHHCLLADGESLAANTGRRLLLYPKSAESRLAVAGKEVSWKAPNGKMPKPPSVRRWALRLEEKKLTGLLTPFWLLHLQKHAPSHIADGYKRQSILTANVWLPASDFAKKARRRKFEIVEMGKLPFVLPLWEKDYGG